MRTGNFVYFDNATHTIRPEHVMASGALPPGFPASRDRRRALLGRRPRLEHAPAMGGRDEPRRDTLAFQVDLWSARGDFPRNMFEVMTREKEIRYSSRTRAGTDQFKHVQKLRHALAALLDKLPEELKNSPEAKLLGTAAERKVYNIVHLIYRGQELRRPFQGLRILAAEHAGALARRLS